MLKKTLLASVITLVAGTTFAAACSADVVGKDLMNGYYSPADHNKKVAEIVVPASCKDFTINLKHVGKAPKAAMGHNVVIAKDKDVNAVGGASAKAGLAKDFIDAKDKRIVAHSKLVGPNETTSVTFPVAKIKDGKYAYFCSFPGHFAQMRGILVVK